MNETVKIKKSRAVATLTAEGLFTEKFWANQGRGMTDQQRKAAQSVVFELDGTKVVSQKGLSAGGTPTQNVPFAINNIDAVTLRNIAKTASKLADLLEGIE